MFAKIATDTALDKTFDYLIPNEMLDKIQPGSRVRVSFGKRDIDGYVISLCETSEYADKVKPIKEIIGERPWLSEAILKIVKWMASYYYTPIELCLRTVIPAPIRNNDVGFKTKTYIEISDSYEEDDERVLKLNKRQKELLTILEETGKTPLSDFTKEQKTTQTTLKKLEAAGLVKIFSLSERRDPLAGRSFIKSNDLPLTEAQANAKRTIIDAITCGSVSTLPPPKPILLFGVTASGKTEVFLQTISETLKQGKDAIVLVPEISLTPQTIQRFASRFGKITAVLHSKLSDGERHDEWHRIYKGEARVVVGPRSAVFAPVRNLGLIIVDEEHEPSYKQEEAPRYNARDVAVMRAHLEHCAVVLGSATPSFESWKNVNDGKYVIASMPYRAASGMSKPNTIIVDMRADFAKTGFKSVFSETLIQAIKEKLETKEQIMLFLNRRGYAPTVSCPKCGHIESCKDCSTAMTYHLDEKILKCHICGKCRYVPDVCPQCSFTDYKYTGIGTQRIETIAQKLFPRAKIQRMDADVTSKKMSHEEILSRFRAREIDILIGTQMIVKGLDFPNVTLAGILNADTSLNIPDFRASERTFQLIAQMAGRTGRGIIPGTVIVQTQNPLEPAITYASTEDFTSFVKEELENREELNYPPFSRFVCITFKGQDSMQVQAFAASFATALEHHAKDVYRVRGPAPAPIERIKTFWRFQISIFTNKIMYTLKVLKFVQQALPTPKEISINIDVDAMSPL